MASVDLKLCGCFGIGAVGVAIIGIVAFGESAAPMRIGFIALIVAGIIGLKLTTPA